MTIPKFKTYTPSIYTDLRERVNAYFSSFKRPQTGNLRLYLKASVLFLAFAGVYIHLIFFTPAIYWALPECVLLGCIVASIGFNVMHDGAHGSFSRRKWVNTLAAFSLNILGGNSFMWNMKHNIIHHAFTNVEGVDDDIDIQPWLRMSKTQKRYPLHKFQHLYFWFFYSLLYLGWMFFMDYQKYFKGKIGDIAIKKMKFTDHVVFWGFKLLHLIVFAGIPVYVLGLSTWIIGFLVFTVVTGFVISIVFQLAHTVEHTAFVNPESSGSRIEDEWAVHQLKTTANFATRNPVVTWLVGGLNYQIEHHLFPKVSHVHYPSISKIVRQVCQEYGVKYIEYPKVRYAIASHVSFLRKMGRA